MITTDEFQMTWAFITSVARTAQLMPIEDVEKVQNLIQHSHALGPIIDPTKYRDGGIDNLAEQQVLADGFMAFRKAIDKVREMGEARRK